MPVDVCSQSKDSVESLGERTVLAKLNAGVPLETLSESVLDLDLESHDVDRSSADTATTAQRNSTDSQTSGVVQINDEAQFNQLTQQSKKKLVVLDWFAVWCGKYKTIP